MKILLTGAHFTPAIAVIEELKKYPNTKIVYMGRGTTMEGDSSKSVESQILPPLGVKFIPIIAGRLQRSFTIHTIPSLLKIPVGILQSLYFILTERPDVILSFGGYVAVPVILVGWLFSIPIIIHEQTLVSGLASKISSYFADKIALSFKDDHLLKDNEIVTGNPIRKQVLEPQKKLSTEYQELFETAKNQKLPVVLFMGGNQGSHVINKVVGQIIDRLTKKACVIHITGDNKFGDYEKLLQIGNYGGKYLAQKWIGDEYGSILKRVDLVVSRAGINTLTELSYFKKPALVIPIPYLYQDEQNVNAKFFEELGIVKVLPQPKLSADTLLKEINNMLGDLDSLSQKAKDSKGVLILNAAKRLALETVLLGSLDNEKKA